MSWDSTNHRMTKPVGLGDISSATNIAGPPYDLGTMITTSTTIEKFAKWHPVISDAVDIPTEEGRKKAGRSADTDYTLVYGVRATGVGNNIAISEIHGCSFEYQQPYTGGTCKFRALDFVHPTSGSTYGYRSDAYLDFSGVVYPQSGALSIVRNEVSAGSIEVWVTYNPHTTSNGRIYEMISIKDFLSNGVLSYEPTDCYPCVLITTNGRNYIRALFPRGGSGTTPTKLSSGTTYWRIDTRNCPAAWTDGNTATVSFFMSSSQKLIAADSSTDITNWVDAGASSAPEGAWTAWFCPIPNSCGRVGTIGSAPTGTIVVVSGIQYDMRKTGLQVMLSLSNATTETLTLIASMGGDTPSASVSISAGATSASHRFVLASAFPNTIFVSGSTNTYEISVKRGSTTIATYSETLTY